MIARLMFEQQRVGHGRALVGRLVELAPTLGYRHLLIECANAKASAFAERLGFTTYDSRRNWVASVNTLRESLLPQTA